MPEEANYLACALVTGASSGLGWEYALQLAPLSNHLVLVARRETRLAELEELLSSKYPKLEVTTITSDLSLKTQRLELFSELSKRGISPTLLINNAGLGDYGEFDSSLWDKNESMIDVNVTALTHLSHHFIQSMKTNQVGAIINVSSIASLVPIPDFAVYAATKAYVTSFSEALRTEVREQGIRVLAVCPGPVKTGFGDVASRCDEKRFSSEMHGKLVVAGTDVVYESLQALFKDSPRVYPGRKVAILGHAVSLLPNFAVRAINALRFRQSFKLDENSD